MPILQGVNLGTRAVERLMAEKRALIGFVNSNHIAVLGIKTPMPRLNNLFPSVGTLNAA